MFDYFPYKLSPGREARIKHFWKGVFAVKDKPLVNFSMLYSIQRLHFLLVCAHITLVVTSTGSLSYAFIDIHARTPLFKER